ncbi:MAG: methylated-DNA--[protein]-cysteine S-methyltransferase [Acidobacteria bacterium]|nr:methylated-DNA--[protein]-cysteine S-methyltransferase [Acidobacteriota bacterium]
MELTYVTVDSPVGPWTVAGAADGVTKVFMPHEFRVTPSRRPDRPVDDAARQLEEYFRGERRTFDVTLAEPTATDFQRDVWRVLRTLPYGTVATYGHVAALTGRPRAARAVGNANHANPWPVLLPCHRVVASDGIGGYGGGDLLKRFLLALEGVVYDEESRPSKPPSDRTRAGTSVVVTP